MSTVAPRRLPDPIETPTLDLWPDACRLIGCGRSAGYEAVKTGTWPTPIIRVGKRIRVPTAAILRVLAADPQETDAGPADDNRVTI